MGKVVHAPRAIDLLIPDIGDFRDVAVIEVLFKPGDHIKAGDALVTLESDKATLEVPAERCGRVLASQVTPGTRVSKGSPLLTLECEENAPRIEDSETTARSPLAEPAGLALLRSRDDRSPDGDGAVLPLKRETSGLEGRSHASPSLRRMAREFGVELARVKGSGPRGRIVRSDLHDFMRAAVSASAPEAGAVAPPPAIDFSAFGPVERQALSRLQRISGRVLASNWNAIPHVTNFENADITDLGSFRKELATESRPGPKITLLSFLVKACAVALKAFPAINASLDGTDVVLKKYVHIGVAVDTPGGLVVPVVRNADQLGLREIAARIESHASQAREGRLARADLEGGCFTVSSLGGIGSTAFTPIINAPEVAILGVSRLSI